ncbi:MAG: dehydrogenase [Epulopiscium sp. Nele67-Bin005]|nr:MAG: dehydrogenase [Epulopiscium sp. Nele67-Bin005]
MKIIIIGAVAGGTSAGAKARRGDENAQITIYDKDKFISYSGCGLPYFISKEVELKSIIPRNANFFKKKYNIDIHTEHEVLKIDKDKKTVLVKNLITGESFVDAYDKLVISTGATPFVPNIKGINNKGIFFLRNINDAINIKEFIAQHSAKKAVVVGSGFIGLEMVESLAHLGLEVTLVEISQKLTPNLDEDMAITLENRLLKKGVSVKKGVTITEIFGEENFVASNQNIVVPREIKFSNEETIPYDIIIMATGVRPNVKLAQDIGIEIGETGAIKVTPKLETNVDNIYACGDCAEMFCFITHKPNYRPLGSTANKTGRIVGENLTGGNIEYRGNISTGIFRVFDIVVASTGLSESEAVKAGYEVEICHCIRPNKNTYMNSTEIMVKGIADKNTHKLLGVQLIGGEGTDKRVDVFATLITYGAKVDELFHLDLAYAPPFSTSKDPVQYTGMILDNSINKNRGLITTDELKTLDPLKVQIVDARSSHDFENKGSVKDAINISQKNVRSNLHKLDKEIPVVVYCNKGVTGNAVQNILINNDFANVKNLSGGHRLYKELEE